MNETNNTQVAAAPALSLADALKALKAENAAKLAAQGEAKSLAESLKALKANGGGAGGKTPFGNSPLSGSGVLARVLATGYAHGVCLTTKEINTQVTAELRRLGQLAENESYGNAQNHCNTLRGQGRIENRRGMGYTLSEAGAEVWHGPGKPFGFAEQADEQPAPLETAETPKGGKKKK